MINATIDPPDNDGLRRIIVRTPDLPYGTGTWIGIGPIEDDELIRVLQTVVERLYISTEALRLAKAVRSVKEA